MPRIDFCRFHLCLFVNYKKSRKILSFCPKIRKEKIRLITVNPHINAKNRRETRRSDWWQSLNSITYCLLINDSPLFLWQRRRKICGVRTNSIYDTLPQMLPASRESEFLLKMIKAWQKEDAVRKFRRCDGDRPFAGGSRQAFEKAWAKLSIRIVEKVAILQ